MFIQPNITKQKHQHKSCGTVSRAGCFSSGGTPSPFLSYLAPRWPEKKWEMENENKSTTHCWSIAKRIIVLWNHASSWGHSWGKIPKSWFNSKPQKHVSLILIIIEDKGLLSEGLTHCWTTMYFHQCVLVRREIQASHMQYHKDSSNGALHPWNTHVYSPQYVSMCIHSTVLRQLFCNANLRLPHEYVQNQSMCHNFTALNFPEHCFLMDQQLLKYSRFKTSFTGEFKYTYTGFNQSNKVL